MWRWKKILDSFSPSSGVVSGHRGPVNSPVMANSSAGLACGLSLQNDSEACCEIATDNKQMWSVLFFFEKKGGRKVQ